MYVNYVSDGENLLPGSRKKSCYLITQLTNFLTLELKRYNKKYISKYYFNCYNFQRNLN